MNKKVISFNKTVHPERKELRRLSNSGYTVICPFCSSEIVFKDNEIFCPQNIKHYYSFACKKLSSLRNELDQERKDNFIKYMKERNYTEQQIEENLAEYFPNSK